MGEMGSRKPFSTFLKWVGSGAKEQKKLFLMGGLRCEGVKILFPYRVGSGAKGRY
ncbi:hypothetical protein X927_04295 [Petrotoga mexicana DSM 14811]|uniref:Uncharacterized protein n=1 Tax=Petrotoga mexicana DSM 14811 TaxID=1122954 RepID=A0A2K1PBT9_9BACT|nr:hypothetical protein X927_04295 [Petrotoga mexicana DSM 14811]